MKQQTRTPETTSPWAWIPSLYLAEGLPYVAVMTISVVMYKRMGVSNTDIALYTSWLYLPWVIKPFWSPFVDLLKTKRWWIVSMQILIGAAFAGIAFMIPVPFFFQATLAFFWLLAFSSATHDIAADGFYMIALDSNTQAKFVGIRSTFYRIATIMGQGVLIILAGFLESATGMEPVILNIHANPEYSQTTMFVDISKDIHAKYDDLHFIVENTDLEIGTFGIEKDELQVFLSEIDKLNASNGFIALNEEVPFNSAQGPTKQSWWSSYISQPLGNWIKTYFGEQRDISVESEFAGNVGAVAIQLSKQPDADKEIVLNTNMHRGNKSITLIKGERFVFNKHNWNKPAYLVFQLDPKLNTATSTEFKGLSGNITFAWSISFAILAALFILFGIYHKFSLPKTEVETLTANITVQNIMSDFLQTFVSFFKKPGVGTAIFFMLTFRFSEAQALKLITPFLLDSRDVGGLGLTTGDVGIVYGTVGIIALTIGGILGGLAAAKDGLKKWLWPMALSVLLPTAVFVYLSYFQVENMWLINLSVAFEQFGYGFGFTAYMLYMIYFSEGKQKTAHYALCTGFMALGMMIPGMFAGWMQELLGYNHFFVWVMICSIIPIIAVSLLKVDPSYGKSKQV